jgi:hypothetical protein
MLASGGYPCTVIRVKDRNTCLKALDSASIEMDINPFAAFVAKRQSGYDGLLNNTT